MRSPSQVTGRQAQAQREATMTSTEHTQQASIDNACLAQV